MRASSDSWQVIDFIHHVLFHFNREQERFVTKALDIKDLGHTNPIDADASFFRFSELFCTELEALTYSGSCDFLALLAPFPRLTLLNAQVAFPAKRPHAVRGDLETMLAVLPPTLEILQLKFRVNEPSMRQMLVAQPPDLNDVEIGPEEADEMLATIAESLCPVLRTLGVDADGLLHCLHVLSSRTPLRHVVAACKERELPLVLWGDVAFNDIEGGFFGCLQDTHSS